MRQSSRIAAGLALWIVATSPSASAARDAPAPRAGFIHGTVVTESGKRYTGVLRWGGEEAFWDDLFNGTKGSLPYIDRQPKGEQQRRDIRVFGVRLHSFWDDPAQGRQFVSRFGDIQEIRVLEGDHVDVVMKSGATYRLEGGSNDIGAVVHVEDPESGEVDIDWKKIERVVFKPAPAAAERRVRRLFGEVTTEAGTFLGFVQWDSQECLSTDRLDGDSEDGKVSLEMGRIRAIEESDENGAWVETTDGRKIHLRGSNDVNDSIRGILVEDARYGRVKISWDAFRRVDFREAPGAGLGYTDYPPAKPLRGTVTDLDGKKRQGRIVFDLDESETWEMLDGERRGVEYSVPFDRIRAIVPHDDEPTTVTLRNGQELKLEESQDVSERNAGVLVIPAGSGPEHYVPWRRVARIDID